MMYVQKSHYRKVKRKLVVHFLIKIMIFLFLKKKNIPANIVMRIIISCPYLRFIGYESPL